MAEPAGIVAFHKVFKAEIAAINARRLHLGQQRKLKPGEGEATISPVPPISLSCTKRDEEVRAQPTPDSSLVGLALSGGGIRSAAFCLGALQGLDASNEEGGRQVLEAVDYLSTVSGGGYIGAAMVSAMTCGRGEFPFASKLDAAEPPAVQHLRDYSNYLAPGGAFDLLVDLVAVIRGILVNALILLSMVFFCAFVTVFATPHEAGLRDPPIVPFFEVRGPFVWTTVLAVTFAAVLFAYAVIAHRRRERRRMTLRVREGTGKCVRVAPARPRSGSRPRVAGAIQGVQP